MGILPLILHAIISLLLIVLIILQYARAAEGGALLGGMNPSHSNRASSYGGITRVTAWIAVLFLVSSAALTYKVSRSNMTASEEFSDFSTQGIPSALEDGVESTRGD